MKAAKAKIPDRATVEMGGAGKITPDQILSEDLRIKEDDINKV